MKQILRLAVLLACICDSPRHFHAQVPHILSYQGRVLVEGVNFDGTGSFRFALVDGAGTTTRWSNDGTSTTGDAPAAAVSVPVAKGLSSVLLSDAPMSPLDPAIFHATCGCACDSTMARTACRASRPISSSRRWPARYWRAASRSRRGMA